MSETWELKPCTHLASLQALGNICPAYVRLLLDFFLCQFDFAGFLDVYNKVDAISLEQVDKLARQPKTVVISCEMDLK